VLELRERRCPLCTTAAALVFHTAPAVERPATDHPVGIGDKVELPVVALASDGDLETERLNRGKRAPNEALDLLGHGERTVTIAGSGPA